MKIFPSLCLVSLLAVPTISFAQATAPKPPMVRRAPAFASWTITYSYKKSERQVSQDSAHVPANAVRSVTVTKTDKTYWVQTLLESGQKSETWIFDGTQLRTIPDSPSIVLVPAPTAESPEPFYLHYDKSDFDELGWVSSENYKGTEMYQGIPAYRFETTKSGMHLSALLSVDAQLPLYFSDGEQTCTYSYNAPPASPLVPPKRFLAVLETHKRGMEALKYHPTHP